MSAEEMFKTIEDYQGEVKSITASDGPNDFAVVQSLMYTPEDNATLTVRFTADVIVTIFFASDDDPNGEDCSDERFEGVEFDAIITQVRRISGKKKFVIYFLITGLPPRVREYVGVYDAHTRTGEFVLEDD